MGQSQPLFVNFCSFHYLITVTHCINVNDLNVVLGIQTWNHRMVAADESTELSCISRNSFGCVSRGSCSCSNFYHSR